MLKKLELCESQVKRNKSATTDAFGLIESIINSSRFSNVVTHLCKTANVSRSGYYNYLKCNDKRKQREKADVVVRDTILIIEVIKRALVSSTCQIKSLLI